MITVKAITLRNITSNLEILGNGINVGENIKRIGGYNGMHYKKEKEV